MKRLIVCADGTWNSRDRDRPTNVEKIAQAIPPVSRDGVVQIVSYDEGVGTSRGLDRLLGGAFGYGLSKNVRDAYRFIVDNYAPGDQIYLFGFSRGAFTVRSTAGLIRKCDLLTKPNAHRFPEAYTLYRRREGGPDSAEAVAFRERYSTPVTITCLGVWDTVGALGIPGLAGKTALGRMINRNYQFHDVKLSSKVVEAAYQALAIDEVRSAFQPAVWWRESLPAQALEQAWFPGCHTNVGGGSATREEARTEGCLSDVAFKWMIDRATQHGLEFNEDYLKTALHPNPLAPVHQSYTGFYRMTPQRRRALCVRPDDPALAQAIEHRRRSFPGEDPIEHPPRLEWTQTIHESAIARVAADPTYRPPNLMPHLPA